MEEVVDVDGLSYKLNKQDFTAEVLKPYHGRTDIFIPRSIKYDSNEYVITSLADSLVCNCIIKSVVFAEDSEVRTINYPFSYSDIEKIVLPPKLENFKENWCCNTSKLIHISLPPKNENFTYLDNKIILGKSDNKSDKYDVLIFARRDIEKVLIPSFVKHISASAFSECKKLKEIKFSENSELLTIGPNAFAFVDIHTFFIPPLVEELKDNWCNHLSELRSITIAPENKNYKYLDENHQIIIGKSDKKSDIFDILIIASRDTVEAFIPSQIKYISSSAFAYCNFFQKIEFENDSNLLVIGKSAFFRSSIVDIKIPKSVKYIGKTSFMDTKSFKTVEFDEDSELMSIEVNLFTGSTIEEVYIPSKVEFIGNFAFSSCSQLKSVEISPNSQMKSIGDSAFSYSLIKEIDIPKHVNFIGEFAFYNCTELARIGFEEGSELEWLGKICFAETNIEEITIPSHVKIIKERTFMNIINLKTVIFPEDSELTTICTNAFVESSVESITLPSKLEKLEDNWCNYTAQLVNIVLSPDNKYFSYLDDDHKIMVAKSEDDFEIFDTIIFASRDIEEVIVPSFIKKINSSAFADCSYIKEFTFSEDSELTTICENAFSGGALQNIAIPHKVKKIDDNAFILCSQLKSVEILGDDLILGHECFCNDSSLKLFALPNAEQVTIVECPFIFVSEFFVFFISAGAVINVVDYMEKRVDYGKGCQPYTDSSTGSE